jgi:hypothetical protein
MASFLLTILFLALAAIVQQNSASASCSVPASGPILVVEAHHHQNNHKAVGTDPCQMVTMVHLRADNDVSTSTDLQGDSSLPCVAFHRHLLLRRARAKWENGLSELLLIKQHHGHCAEGNTTSSALRRWMSTQRILCKKGRLLSDRYEFLERMGFLWDKHMLEWEKKYSKLKEFKAKFGHCNVPYNSKYERSLGAWVFNQRVMKRSNKLSVRRQERLTELGFMWNMDDEHWQKRNKENEWRARYRELLLFRLKHGHTNVKKKSGRLGRWVVMMKSLCKSGRMQSDRLAMLQAADFAVGKRNKQNFLSFKGRPPLQDRIVKTLQAAVAWPGDGSAVPTSTRIATPGEKVVSDI